MCCVWILEVTAFDSLFSAQEKIQLYINIGNKVTSWRPWCSQSMLAETWQHQAFRIIYGNKICHCVV